MHPEHTVVTSDATTTGRNYFSRASASGQTHMIHSFPAHDDEKYHDAHGNHQDHFSMDEDLNMFEEICHELVGLPDNERTNTAGSDEKNNLSRSPSSVMLFTGEHGYSN
jgi:hypothetical protein